MVSEERKQEVRNDELLQSEEWMRFQEAAGHTVVPLSGADWSANGIVHTLPIVGRYLYTPRAPRLENTKPGLQIPNKTQNPDYKTQMKTVIESLLAKASELQVGWIRVEPESEEVLNVIREAMSGVRMTKAPHDMQPREILKIPLAPTEDKLLAGMKSKTRYNIRVAEKRGVKVIASTEKRYVDAFIRLVSGTADRKGITPHPRAYYEKMCDTLLGGYGKIYAAEKDGQIIAANLVVIYGDTATYLHGGSDDRFRADMAPYILQWEAMREAKRRGCAWYDFGGVNMAELEAGAGKWYGITRFKTGFSPATPLIVYPGAYDIVLSPVRYGMYRVLQRMKQVSVNIIH